MLITTKTIFGSTILGTDGQVGKLKDLLFDQRTWKVRYLDVDTGRWLSGRRVILSPDALKAVDYGEGRLVVGLSRQQIEDSPPLEKNMPVSRRMEAELARHYAWGAYWAAAGPADAALKRNANPALRIARAVSGYRIQAIDGQIGYVDQFMMDDAAAAGGPWEIRYLVVDTGDWLPGRHVLLPPLWAESICWDARKINIALTRELVEYSPTYDQDAPLNREYEEALYDYYGRPAYWRGRAV